MSWGTWILHLIFPKSMKCLLPSMKIWKLTCLHPLEVFRRETGHDFCFMYVFVRFFTSRLELLLSLIRDQVDLEVGWALTSLADWKPAAVLWLWYQSRGQLMIGQLWNWWAFIRSWHSFYIWKKQFTGSKNGWKMIMLERWDKEVCWTMNRWEGKGGAVRQLRSES